MENRNLRALGSAVLLSAALASPALLGCDTTKFTADTTAGLFQRAQPAFQEHWDYELAGEAIPGNIIQMEGLLRASPENESLLLNTIQLYSAYAFGWIEDRVEQLRVERSYSQANVQLRRARYFYQRSLDLGRYRMGLRHEGYQEAYDAGLPEFQEWLREEFTEPEDAEDLFWVGYPMISLINAAKDELSLVAELPFATALIERSVELDEDYFYGAGLIALAAAATELPSADLDAAGERWEHMLQVTERRNLVGLVQMARLYAVKRHDREMYVALLREVLEAGDIAPENRLQNAIARQRADRYLRLVEERFPE